MSPEQGSYRCSHLVLYIREHVTLLLVFDLNFF